MCTRMNWLPGLRLKGNVALALAMIFLIGGCSLSPVAPPPTFIVTVNIVPTLTPGPGSRTPTPSKASPTPSHDWALSFDGVDDYVRVEEDPSLDLENSFTIAAWIYMDEYTEWASLVTKGDKPNINNYAIHQSGPVDPIYKTEFGKLRFSGCVGLPVPLPESQTILTLNTWHFVAVTFDGTFLRYYLNGRPDGSIPVQGPLCTNDEPFYIGVDFPLTTEYWHGAIDEVRVWNVALSEGQILDLMNGVPSPSDSGLVGYWRFDEGSGSIAQDNSGYGNDGTLVGNPVWLSPDGATQ